MTEQANLSEEKEESINSTRIQENYFRDILEITDEEFALIPLTIRNLQQIGCIERANIKPFSTFVYSTTNSEITISFDFKSLKNTPPHILLKMMLKINLMKNGKGIEEFQNTELNTITMAKVEQKEQQKQLQQISTLNKTGESIYPPSEHVWNNYNENEEQIKFEDGWDEEQ